MARLGYRASKRVNVSSRDGFTLIELMVAVMLFTGAMLIGGRTIVEFIHQVGVSEVRAQATEFALEEMERVRLLPYERITSIGSAPVPEAPDYMRAVDVAVVGADPSDVYAYRVITVTVEPPAGLDPVRISSAVAE
jgi:prepilin-type N-terminal cleavage/methylation domain-containing protein